MGNILNAFLRDQLRVDEGTKQRTPEHRRLSEKDYELQNKLAEKLNDEEKEILTELVDTLFDEASVDAYQKSERGFQLGVLMMVEVFAEQNTFL